MGRWYFDDAGKYGELGKWWKTEFNTATDDEFRKKLVELGAKDESGDPVTEDNSKHKVSIKDDKSKKTCLVIRPDEIGNLSYLENILDEVGSDDPTKESYKEVLLGVYLITRCR